MAKLVSKVRNKINEKIEEKRDSSLRKPFEEEHVIEPLKLFFIIVPYGQANGVIKILNSVDASFSIMTNGEGTYQRETQLYGLKKQILITIIKNEKIEEFKEKIMARFNTSSQTKGVAFSIKLTSVAGVSVYKFLSNSRTLVKKNHKGK